MHKQNILLCGGGTGGHYYPLMAIKKDLELKSDFKFLYVGAKKGIENSKIKNERIDYKLVSISGIQRKISISSIFNNTKVPQLITINLLLFKYFAICIASSVLVL